MSGEDITASLGDFAAVLVREVSQSLLLAETEAPLIHVHTVRIRFGQPPAEEAEANGSLLSERYPFLGDGWEVEMEMDGKVQAQLAGRPLPSIDPGKPLLAVFGDLPLTHLKGINTEWAKFFTAMGVTTIGSLASVSQETVSTFVRRKRSVKWWEYIGKARLLEMCIPALPSTPLDNKSIYSLQQMTPTEIFTALGARSLSSRETDILFELFALLAVAIDSALLKKISLGHIRQA